MSLSLEEIAPKKGERAIILGGSRSGKSVLEDMLLRHAVQTRPNIKALLLDSKPRFRAELYKKGPLSLNAEKHYVDWAPGPVIPGSYRADIHSETPLKGYWKNNDPCRVVILQSGEDSERGKLLEVANGFYEAKMRNADRLLVVDELLDFYHGNGVCISRHNVPQKVSRAGGERGIGGLYGAQRPRGIPGQTIEEASIIYLFYLRFSQDMKYLYEQGIPTSIVPPDEELYVFKVIRIQPGGKAEYMGQFRLTLYDWYLKQLSDT